MSDSTPPDRTLSWWPFVGAAVIVALVAAVIFFIGGGEARPGTTRDANGALACPSAYNPNAGEDAFWVPAKPSGVDGGRSLTPKSKPTHVTVCRYGAPNPDKRADVRLSGHRRLTGEVAAASKTLAAAPKRTGTATRDNLPDAPVNDYLLGLIFGGGYVWVAVPATPAGASNGDFVTDLDLRQQVAAAYRTGSWPS